MKIEIIKGTENNPVAEFFSSSSTPETDARTYVPSLGASTVPAEFARRLERERDEARAERDAWRKHAERFAAILSDETPLATIGTDIVEALEKLQQLKEETK